MSATLRIEQRVKGPPERAFMYFTDPEKHVQWQGVRADLDPRPGGDYVIHFNERSRVRGRYLEVDPPHRLVIAWGWESESEFPPGARDVPPASTTLEISFVADGDGTMIRLIHVVPAGEFVDLADQTWGMHLRRLVRVASGETVEPEPLVALLAALGARR